MHKAIVLAYSLFFVHAFEQARKRFRPHMAEDIANSAMSILVIDLLENPVTVGDPEEVALDLADRWVDRVQKLNKEDQNREHRKPQLTGDDSWAGGQFHKMGWSCPNPEEALIRKEWKVRMEIAKKGLDPDDLKFLEATKAALEARLDSLDRRFGNALGTRNEVQNLNGPVGQLLGHASKGEAGYDAQRISRKRQQRRLASQLAWLRD